MISIGGYPSRDIIVPPTSGCTQMAGHWNARIGSPRCARECMILIRPADTPIREGDGNTAFRTCRPHPVRTAMPRGAR